MNRRPFQPVSLSLADLCGNDYIQALCSNRALLSGENAANLEAAATTPIDFFPESFERRLLQLLPRVGQTVGRALRSAPASRGATTRQFEVHAKLNLAPVSALGYFRIGEDGKLYF